MFPISPLMLWLVHCKASIPICAMMIVLSGMLVKDYQHRKIKKIHGNAHWASMREIKKMGLFDCKEGLIIGEKHGRLLRAPLISHALVFAPSRSGKGVSQVMPNALTFKDSLLVVDIKHEIFRDTSSFRQKHGQDVFLFSPASLEGKTHRWNPLDLVRRDTTRLIADIDLITQTLVSYTYDTDSMWVSEARALLKGLLLWLMDSGRPFTLGEITNFVKGSRDFIKELTDICNEAITEEGKISIHPAAFNNLNNFTQKAPKEQSGVKSTLTARLNLWDDPCIQAATNTSDFDFRDMRKKRMTIYLGIPTDQLERLAPLMNFFLQLFINVMTEELPKKNEPYKVLMILDEFCALGRMEKLKSGFGFLAGYHIHMMAVIQNVGQFYDLYGGRDKSDVFFQNTDYKIAYRQNTRTDQEFISNQLGTYAAKNKSQSYKHTAIGNIFTGANESYMTKPLLSPEEVRVFPADEGIAIINGQPPIKYKKIIHYKDKRFNGRIVK